MKNILKTSAMSVTMIVMGCASANASALYLAGRGAVFHPKASDTNNAYSSDLDMVGNGFGGAIGVHNDLLLMNVRLEAEYFYRTKLRGDWTGGGPLVKMDTRAHTGMANLYIDLNLPMPIFPNMYIMGGAGFSVLQNKLDDADKTNVNFAWSAGAGFNAKLPFTGLYLDLGYRYVDLGKSDDKNIIPYSLEVHELIAGVRIRF